MKLPQEFIDNMQAMLKEQWQSFLESYEREPYKGIRINTLKISVKDFLEITDFKLEPIPWTRNGFYVLSDEKLGKHPHYLAGLYYIQEPSAMLPAELSSPVPGDIVLDLCAAPGGKSMQVAAMLDNQGLLVANDVNSKRLKALIRNAELMGVRNILVLNDWQDKISGAMYGMFDKLIIDAPCSGEGMFKKHDEATSAYADYDVDTCVTMQKEILDEIPKVLKGYGELVYSTCTFNTKENEEMIAYLSKHYTVKPLQTSFEMFEKGYGLPEALRVFPHKVKGEGHFAVKLQIQGTENRLPHYRKATAPPDLFVDFCKQVLKQTPKGHYKIIKDRLFLLPEIQLPTGGVKVVKEGWYLGDLKKNRFEPSHAMALALKADDCIQTINFTKDDPLLIKYLKCETLHCDGQAGYNLICVDGHPIGWGKWAKGRLKNLYPAAWRLQ